MTIVQYYEMLPINGKIVRHDIFELCDSKFREKKTDLPGRGRDSDQKLQKGLRL